MKNWWSLWHFLQHNRVDNTSIYGHDFLVNIAAEGIIVAAAAVVVVVGGGGGGAAAAAVCCCCCCRCCFLVGLPSCISVCC